MELVESGRIQRQGDPAVVWAAGEAASTHGCVKGRSHDQLIHSATALLEFFACKAKKDCEEVAVVKQKEIFHRLQPHR